MELLSHPSVDFAQQNAVHEAYLANRQSNKLHNMKPAAGPTAYQRLHAEAQAAHEAQRRSAAPLQPTSTQPLQAKSASQNWSVLLDPFIAAKRAERMEKLLLEKAKAEREEQEAFAELCALGGAQRAERESLAPTLSKLPRAVDKPGANLREANLLAGTAKQYVAGTAKARYAALYMAIRE